MGFQIWERYTGGRYENPTNIVASVHLVMGCPNARADAKIVEKREPLEQPTYRAHIKWCRPLLW